MGKSYALIASAFVFTVMAPLATVAYTQTDVNFCTPDALRLCFAAIPDATVSPSVLPKTKGNLAPPAPSCLVVHAAQASTANPRQLFGILISGNSELRLCHLKRTFGQSSRGQCGQCSRQM